MVRNKNELSDLAKELNKGVLPGVEEVVKELQFLGPSWTGVYSNSWQIQVGNKKSTGTRRAGEPKAVKAPKMNVKSIRAGRVSKDEIKIEIRNLRQKRIKGYAEDTIEGRFRRGKVRNKVIGIEPRTSLGKSKFEQVNQGRVIGFRGDIGGGRDGGISSRTAELDWLPKYLKGGSLQQTIKLELNKGLKKGKGKKLK